jgi:hypothetical protein
VGSQSNSFSTAVAAAVVTRFPTHVLNSESINPPFVPRRKPAVPPRAESSLAESPPGGVTPLLRVSWKNVCIKYARM